MAILRAGPFATSSSSFLDEPVTPTFSTLPVNCAKDTTSTDWPWRHYQASTNVTMSYENGLPSLTDSSTSATAEEEVGGGFSFRYQAAEAFTMELSYSASASTAGGFFDTSEVSMNVFLGGNFLFGESDSDTDASGQPTSASISGTETINLPASVLPKIVRLSIEASGTSPVAGSSASFSASLTS